MTGRASRPGVTWLKRSRRPELSQLALDLAAALNRRRVLGGIAFGLSGAALAACGNRATAQAALGPCPASPTETRGPFPADGTSGRRSGINVLDLEGVVRRDIRPSFAGMSGLAEGVPLELELQLVEAAGCTPSAGCAVYLWENDAAGDYSLFNRTEVNYLRGMQASDAQGRLTFTAIILGCYGGRYPHCHFEVFESLAAAAGGTAPLLVSQLAYPTAECRAIYRADRRYGASLSNLDRLPIERDFVFADADAAERARQTITLSGDRRGGYRGTARISLSAA